MANYASLIDLRHLRYFIAVAAHRSFRRAALELNVSQPPLSRQIQQLEDILGVRLLERHNRGIVLTPAGEAFYADAENLLALVEQSASKARAIGTGQGGRLNVGVFGSAIFDIVPRIILAFRDRNPNVEVSLHTLSREEQVKALQERRIDIGFNRFFSEYPGLFWQAIASEEILAAVPIDNSLSDRTQISFEDLREQPLIFYPPIERSGGFSNYLLRLFHARNLSPQVVQNVEDVVTAMSLVSSGFGIALGVESIRNFRIPGVRFVPLEKADSASIDLSLIARSADGNPALKEFILTAQMIGNHGRWQGGRL